MRPRVCSERGYLAGFGIAPEARRQGLGELLLKAQVETWQQHGLKQAQLEVMEANPARHLHAQAGFVAQRRLLVLQGALRESAPGAEAALQPVPLDTLARLHERLNAASPPTWRREWTTVRQAAQALLPEGQALAWRPHPAAPSRSVWAAPPHRRHRRSAATPRQPVTNAHLRTLSLFGRPHSIGQELPPTNAGFRARPVGVGSSKPKRREHHTAGGRAASSPRPLARYFPRADLRVGRLRPLSRCGSMRAMWLATMPATVRATAFTSSGSSKIISTVA